MVCSCNGHFVLGGGVITDHWQKYIFQNTRHQSSNTTCIFRHTLHAYFVAWKCIAFRRMGLVELQLKLAIVNTWSDNKVHELATMCLPWQHWTKALVWFDDIDISAFHSCVVVDLWQSVSKRHLLLSACVLACHHENVGA